MDTIRTGTGREIATDYVSSIPNPKRLYFRALGMTRLELDSVLDDPAEMSCIHYNGYAFDNCSFVAISEENGIPKAHLNYEVFREEADDERIE